MRTRLALLLLLFGLAAHARTARGTEAEAADSPADCSSDSTLCLGGGRFVVGATWTKSDGESGPAHAVSLTADAGYFWFFGPDNVELLVKTLDGCGVNGRSWFFSAGLTNLEVVITVHDTATGDVRTYASPSGTAFQPILDTDAFAGCSAVALLVTLTRYQFSPGGPDGPPIRLSVGVTYTLTFRSLDVEHGISSIPALGIADTRITPGADYVVTITPTFSQRGLYNFACTRVCGAGHGGMHGAIEVD